MKNTTALRTNTLKMIIRHGLSVREFDELKRKKRINKNKINNLIYLDEFLTKNK